MFPYFNPYPLIAPYWTDIDLQGGIGNVSYTVYTTDNGSAYIEQMNEFITNTEAVDFTAIMMLVAQWKDVCHFEDDMCNEVN